MSNKTHTVQRNMVNDAVKESKEVKVIVLKDGTLQVVGINETYVDDVLPDADPIAELISDKVSLNAFEANEKTEAEATIIEQKPETPPVAPPATKINKQTKSEDKPPKTTKTSKVEESASKEKDVDTKENKD